jgi:hypothetical protein
MHLSTASSGVAIVGFTEWDESWTNFVRAVRTVFEIR